MGGDCGAPRGATTAAQQEALERAVASVYGDPPRELALLRAPHAQYLLGGLRHLSAGHCGAPHVWRARGAAGAASQPSTRRADARAPARARAQRWTPAGRGWCSGSRTAWRCWR
jgi:hypothetical protein